MARKFVDCRETPSVSNCSLRISGEEEEVVRAAAMHAADVHGHEDTPEFRTMIRSSLKEDRGDGAPRVQR
jgi:predicted small metal-binding protein